MTNKIHTVLVAGATGLTGSFLLNILLNDPDITRVYSIQRKPFLSSHPKLRVIETDDFEAFLLEWVPDIPPQWVYCCLGTTMKKAGSKEAFEKVDKTYVLELARWALRHKVGGFSVVSALGASSRSLFYYNRVKGDMEKALCYLGFDQLHIFRPSLLLGNRKEKRTGEKIGIVLYRFLKFLIPAKYQGIEAERVASLMHTLSRKDTRSGIRVLESDEIRRLTSV